VRAIPGRLRSYDLIVRLSDEAFLCVMAGATIRATCQRFAEVQTALTEDADRCEIRVGFAALAREDTAAELLECAVAQMPPARLRARVSKRERPARARSASGRLAARIVKRIFLAPPSSDRTHTRTRHGLTMAEAQPPGESSGGQLAVAISNMVVQVLREHAGRGPTKSRTHVNDDLISVVVHGTLTRAEHTLITTGNKELVLRTREALQETMRADLIAGVEALTGRTVTAFFSDNLVDPDIALESFLLASEPAGDR
jgi:uncharacterized protein YbcI